LLFGFSIIGGNLLPEAPLFNTYSQMGMEGNKAEEETFDKSPRLSPVEIEIVLGALRNPAFKLHQPLPIPECIIRGEE